ncbi:MAG: aspartate--ammonia ligase [Bacilli bacterium]|nr:aspartate--ammonia ligase [Bacilli bacterium]
MNLLETQVAIKFIKDRFEAELAKKLHLTRVSAPLFVKKSSGLNDELNGVEETVSFNVQGEHLEIVQSLAKWKRDALSRYGFAHGEGLYTDMNAIRKDETLDALHSLYVDQWDWEKIIDKEERCLPYLFATVRNIYRVILSLAKTCEKRYGFDYGLPTTIKMVSTKQLLKKYPSLPSKERENAIVKEYGAVFLYGIGWPLNKKVGPHDGRAADYDDWNLNGDILLYDKALDASIELSSMGIRVDAEALTKQLAQKGENHKLSNPYCQNVLQGKYPFTIGGGIGQSRLCMYYLQKKHIGEVQSSYWPEELLEKWKAEGLKIL